MKFLLDCSPDMLAAKREAFSDLIGGQLLTPATRYRVADGTFAIDNGAFSGFDAAAFQRVLNKAMDARERCLFVTVPDVVGSGRRTLELWHCKRSIPGVAMFSWRLALVAQNGIEDLDIPWQEIDALFIGGMDPWKDSRACLDVVRAAKILGKHVHVGRVNELGRYLRFAEVGADTCDGTGVVRFDHMLERIRDGLAGSGQSLFTETPSDGVAT